MRSKALAEVSDAAGRFLTEDAEPEPEAVGRVAPLPMGAAICYSSKRVRASCTVVSPVYVGCQTSETGPSYPLVSRGVVSV